MLADWGYQPFSQKSDCVLYLIRVRGGVCLGRRQPHTHRCNDRIGCAFLPYSDWRFHLFGGRFRMGDPVEYAISASVVIACIALSYITGGQGFAPFFYDWAGMYE